MADYGLTPNGPNIKRLDVILDDMHSNLSKKWGVNTKQNPESLVNHLLTNIADAIAELWEFGEKIYYSQYPATAEGISLDNAAQFGGSTRESAARSYYPIHCTGIDNTKLVAGTSIASATNPVTMLTLLEDKVISRSNCNSAVIKVSTITTDSPYTLSINGALYSYSSSSTSPVTVLQGIAALINADESNAFAASVDTDNALMTVADSANPASSNRFLLSENLTTEKVTSVINFSTEQTGDIYLPDGVITNIIRADTGLQKVENKCGYIAGRDRESDVEFRQSYAAKIFNRSAMMLESIRSAILNNVQGVSSVAAYENDTNSTRLERVVFTVSDRRPNYHVKINGTVYTLSFEDYSIANRILEGIETLLNNNGYTNTTLDTSEHTLLLEFDQPSTENIVEVSDGLALSLIGRPPHSIEIVVEGGDNTEIAKQIFDKKAAGIQTYGDVLVTLTGQYDEDIAVRFNRPETIYVYFDVTVTQLAGATLPTNYADILKDVVIKNMASLDAGDDVIPQTFISELYTACPGIAYIDIALYHTSDATDAPDNNDYSERVVSISARQKAYTDLERIRVILDG